jgi:hypothetical protein
MSEFKKFQKVAVRALARRRPSGPSAATPSSTPISGSTPAATPASTPPAGPSIIDKLKDFFGLNSEDVNEEDLKEAAQYITALIPGWTEKRYSPSAFYHALEMDGNRGYNDTIHSQGAYEMTDPKFLKEIADFKKNPTNLTNLLTNKPIDSVENINVDETSDRYKAMRKNLYAESNVSSEPKFIKTSQKSNAEELKKIIPNWQITDVLNDMAKVSARKDLSNAEKQQGMVNVLSQYEKSIAPLNQYLKSNDIKYK